MADVILFNGAAIHPDAIREAYVEEDSTNVFVITEDAIHHKEFGTGVEAQEALDKVLNYLNIVEEI